jgi:hypothetical protein
MSFEADDVQRKTVAILSILSQFSEPIGTPVACHRLQGDGVTLSERAVRYHVKLIDERGFTESVGRERRVITQLGLGQLETAPISDKVGFVASKIGFLAYQTNFSSNRRQGKVPVNVSFFRKAIQ